MLDDPDRGALRHLARRVPETVLRNNRVRVNEEDDLAQTARASVRCPRPELAPARLVHLVDRHLERLLLEVLPLVLRADLAPGRVHALAVPAVQLLLVLAVPVPVLHPVPHLLVDPVRAWGQAAPTHADVGLARLFAREEGVEVFLRLQGEREAVVHVGGLLEAACTLEPAGRVVVLRARDPADAVLRVEHDARVALLDGEQPETVVVDENRGRTTLAGVCLHGLLERLDRRCPAERVSARKRNVTWLGVRTIQFRGFPCRRAFKS